MNVFYNHSTLMNVSHMAEYSVIARGLGKIWITMFQGREMQALFDIYDAFLFTTLKTFSLPGHSFIFLLAAVSFLFTNYLTVIILVINF